jgi:phosphatidylinositol alpha-1,6-mannosyltransferase
MTMGQRADKSPYATASWVLTVARCMRVGIVPQRYSPDFGGVARASQRYAHGLVQAGHRAAVICLDAKLAPGRTERNETNGVLERRVGAHRRTDDALGAWFEAVVAEHGVEPFDVLVGRYLDSAAFVAVYAARFLGIPSVVSARGNDVDSGAFDASTFSRLLWTTQHADAVTAVSHELSRKLAALVPGLEPLVVPNGVDTELFRPGPPEPEMGSAPTLLFVGEARKKKGLPLLLEAHARVTTRFPGARLLLVGGVRPDDAEILTVFNRKHPAVLTFVVPAVEPQQLPRYYRSASLFMMPSLRDGLPNALLEAMACGCPIVASNVGGIPDAVRDGVEGRLVPAGQSEALARACIELLEGPAAAAALGARARQRAVEGFGLEQERGTDLALLQRLVRAG